MDQSFLSQMLVYLAAAVIVVPVFKRLGLGSVLGFLVAGVIIGPYLLPVPLVEDEATIRTLADLGVIFLLFSLGLEFSVRRLLQMGWPVLITALIELPVMVWLGYLLGSLLDSPGTEKAVEGPVERGRVLGRRL